MGRLERMLAILGVSSLWAWVFCLFPSVGASSPPLASHGFGSLVEWSASIAVGTIASFVLVAVYHRWSSRRLDAAVAAMGTLAQLLCLLCFLGGAQWPVLALVGACFSGIAIAFLWVPWGMVLRGLDIAVVEEVFGGALALLGVEYLIVSSLPAEFSAGALGVLPPCVLCMLHRRVPALVSCRAGRERCPFCQGRLDEDLSRSAQWSARLDAARMCGCLWLPHVYLGIPETCCI